MNAPPSGTRPELSVVVPVLDEEENLEALHERVTRVLEKEGISFELLLVDDGSTDATPALLEALCARDARVRALTLTRNFGHQPAISAGIDHARGRAVILMDADLQDPPEVFPAFLAAWRSGAQVAYGVRRKRKEGLFKRGAYSVYYRLLARASEIEIPRDAGDFCLMDAHVVELLKELPEKKRFVRGLRAWVGLKQVAVPYERAARAGGEVKYSLRRLLSLASLGLVSFSLRPLRLALLLGFLMAGLSVGLALFYGVLWVFTGSGWPEGFATLVVALSFLFGVQFILIGILGIYVGSIHEESKGRPTYLVAREIGGGARENEA